MAFDSLSEKLQNVFKNLRSKGRLTEDDVKAALKEVKMALLEADVNFKVVKGFIKDVQERAVGQDVMNGLNPGQMVIKIVNEELVKLMGSETTEIKLQPGSAITVIMMAGLQGAGKTTTTAKLAGKFKLKGKKPLLVACDVYRPAAIKQLEINAEKQGVEMFSMGDKNKPADIAKAAVEHAAKNGNNIVILDTAGRLHVDEDMMAELQEIKEAVEVHQTILVVDAMTGQDAVNVASSFNDKIGIDGVIVTKLDGDTRGGAALSIKAVTGKPILYVGMGEKLSDLEQFYPDRMASRILGMGDVLSLIEKAGAELDEEKAKKMADKMKKAQFDFEDYLRWKHKKWELKGEETSMKKEVMVDMTSGRIAPQILKFAMPVLLGNVFQQFYNMVDTIIVGRYLGEDALAAVGSTGCIMFLVLGFATGIAQGFGVMISHAFGAKDFRLLKHYVALSLILTVIVSAILTIPTVAASRLFLVWMHTPDNILSMADAYIKVIFAGIILTMLYNVSAGILRGIGDSKTPLYFLIFSSILNVVLDLLFIIVLKAGTAGAAYATIIAQGISAILCFIHMFRQFEILRTTKADYYLDRPGVINMLSIGITMALNYSITAIGTMILQSAVNVFGSFLYSRF